MMKVIKNKLSTKRILRILKKKIWFQEINFELKNNLK